MMEDKRSRRYFAREFKVEAVELLLHGNKTAVEVARDWGIRTEILYRWKNEYVSDKAQAFPGTARSAFSLPS